VVHFVSRAQDVSTPIDLRMLALLKPGLDRVAPGRVVVEDDLELMSRFVQPMIPEQGLNQDHPYFMIRRVEAKRIARGLDRRIPFLTL
jgi:hypothetical protein